jgi:hypothetical protein
MPSPTFGLSSSEIKAAFQELQAALNAQLAAVTAIIATLP